MASNKTEIESLFQDLPQRRRTPVSTYRMQLHREFGFRDARAIAAYLSDLGVTDYYSSPILKALPGSLHGYDICDHNTLNPELGSESDFEELSKELQTRDLGVILDFVPNHMAADANTNPWWRDVLENGPSSPYARYFDIHWYPVKPELKGKVLLPILGDQYGVVLERGELDLRFSEGRFTLRYFEHDLPVNPQQYPSILRHQLEALKSELKDDDPSLREFLSILTAFDNLPASSDTNTERIAERQREKSVAQERLARLALSDPRIQQHVERAVTVFNGEPGQPETFDPLHALLEAQAYRLAYWKTASHEINYRRFFDINALAGLRVENDPVFPITHQLTMRLLAENKITGLRIDHPDGLYDPALYFEAVQDMFLQEWAKTVAKARGGGEVDPEAIRAWRVAERKRDPKGLAAKPLYIVAEKILSGRETLDAHWAIDGTSGYDFLNDLNGVFVASRNGERMQDIYKRFTGKMIPFELLAPVCKRLIMSTSMASELNVLAHTLNNISERDRRVRDFTLDTLRDALKELIAYFPVYRTYLNSSRAGATDREIIERAVSEAKRRNPMQEPSIFDFIRSVLTHENADKVTSEEFRRQLSFTMKLQQYTGPVQAKGLEDTAFYRYTALVSLNEVGGDPARFGTEPAAFHEANLHRRQEWPTTMLGTATHDTKRGEDARARLNVLSEIPEEWEKTVGRWSQMNQGLKIALRGEHAPERNDEYLYYQALLGAWTADNTGPLRAEFVQRMQDYMVKAIKEAKLRTSWISPNETYETGVRTFVEKTLADDRPEGFLASFVSFAKRIAYWGMLNSLSQLVLKLAAPGVADFYQGCELWDFSLVDPDNRRKVDYQKRKEKLDRLRPLMAHVDTFIERQQAEKQIRVVGQGVQVLEANPLPAVAALPLSSLMEKWEEGDIKMFVTASGLRIRRSNPLLFLEGEYLPFEIEGERAEHVVAFGRRHGGVVLIAIVSRLPATLVPGADRLPIGENIWKNTAIILPEKWAVSRSYYNVFTGEEAQSPATSKWAVAELLRTCPVGLFYSNPSL